MKEIKPIGANLLVLPLPQESHQTESKVIIIDNKLSKAKVMEVSDEYSTIYKKGDVVIYPESAGISQYYKQQNCLWLNPIGYPQGHILGIVSDESEK